MSWLNRYEVVEARQKYRTHPVLGPATATLSNLMEAVDSHGDGWAYWQAPTKAAEKLMELIEGEEGARWDRKREDATHAKLKRAYVPLKSFRTRKGLAFDIVEVDESGAPLIFQQPQSHNNRRGIDID